MMPPYSIFQGLGDLLVAVARVRGRDVGGGHRRGPALRRRCAALRVLDAVRARRRGSRGVVAARRCCAATASRGEACFWGQPSLWGQNELRSARGAAKVWRSVATTQRWFSGRRLSCAGAPRRFYSKLWECLGRWRLCLGFVDYSQKQWSWGAEEPSTKP